MGAIPLLRSVVVGTEYLREHPREILSQRIIDKEDGMKKTEQQIYHMWRELKEYEMKINLRMLFLYY